MKNKHLFLNFLFFFCYNLIIGQNLPVQTVTLFKNGKGLLFKLGNVPTPNGKFSTRELPYALFGTYWVNSSTGTIESLFAIQDSVEESIYVNSKIGLIKNNIGKSVRLTTSFDTQTDKIEGIIENVLTNYNEKDEVVFIKTANKWIALSTEQIKRIEFIEKPLVEKKNKELRRRLDVNFKEKKEQQEIGLSYLTKNIGWTPLYRLELQEKNKGLLALKAEIFNDAEDIGKAELQLAVATPNFTKTDKLSLLLNFNNSRSYDVAIPASYSMQTMQRSRLYSESSIEIPDRDDEYALSSYNKSGANFEGGQLEDYYFYTINPGNFPKNSRFQYPVFEQAIQTEHLYECNISANNYTKTKKNEYPVYHYIEFLNNTKFPWTAGVVSILTKPISREADKSDKTTTSLTDLKKKTGNDLQPISQEDLPYTAANDKCKIPISQAFDIKVTHIEGDLSRTEKAKKSFNKYYDLVKSEGQIGIVNLSHDTIKLKIRRNIEGTPLESEQNWNKKQEQSSLQINSSYILEWEIQLKPGEEKKWKYTYEYYLNKEYLNKD